MQRAHTGRPHSLARATAKQQQQHVVMLISNTKGSQHRKKERARALFYSFYMPALTYCTTAAYLTSYQADACTTTEVLLYGSIHRKKTIWARPRETPTWCTTRGIYIYIYIYKNRLIFLLMSKRPLYYRPYCHIQSLDLFRSAVPFWGQLT